MSLLDTNMICNLLEDLSLEFAYKISENTNVSLDMVPRTLTFTSDGTNHKIFFLGICLYDTKTESKYAQLNPEKEIELNTRENFEEFIRRAIHVELETLNKIDAWKP